MGREAGRHAYSFEGPAPGSEAARLHRVRGACLRATAAAKPGDGVRDRKGGQRSASEHVPRARGAAEARRSAACPREPDPVCGRAAWKSVVEGKRVSVRVVCGGRRIMKKKNRRKTT